MHERFASAIAAGVVEVHRETSEAAALLFPDGYFDFVYVDGDHTYEFVRRDLAVYRPKLKTDAVLAGDDYALRGWWEWGVKRAVDEAVNEHAYEPIWLGRQFVTPAAAVTRKAPSRDLPARRERSTCGSCPSSEPMKQSVGCSGRPRVGSSFCSPC